MRGEIAQLIRSAASIIGTADQLRDDPSRVVGSQRLPVDPSIRAGDAEYLARVLVRIPQADGSVVTTLVTVPFDGPTSIQDIVAAAIAAAQGNTTVPPPPTRPGGRASTGPATGTLESIGRGSPTMGF